MEACSTACAPGSDGSAGEVREIGSRPEIDPVPEALTEASE